MKVCQITFVLVVGLVVILCLMFGCEDKAEAKDPNDYDIFIDCTFGVLEPNEPELLIVVPELRKFEDRDPNEILIHFSLNKDGRETQEVILDIDSNGLLRLRTVNCDLKEAAKIVWELLSSLM